MTALMLAASNDNVDTVRLLLNVGADIEAKDIVSKRISTCTCVFCMCACYILSL